MPFFDLLGAGRSAHAHTTALPLAASGAQLDDGSLRIHAARPARADFDPSLASNGLGLLGHDGHARWNAPADQRRGAVWRGADGSAANADVGVDTSAPVAKSPHDQILPHAAA